MLHRLSITVMRTKKWIRNLTSIHFHIINNNNNQTKRNRLQLLTCRSSLQSVTITATAVASYSNCTKWISGSKILRRLRMNFNCKYKTILKFHNNSAAQPQTLTLLPSRKHWVSFFSIPYLVELGSNSNRSSTIKSSRQKSKDHRLIRRTKSLLLTTIWWDNLLFLPPLIKTMHRTSSTVRVNTPSEHLKV